ncbi:MAG: helix-turn-helix transcriptional regulator [Pseudohongiella sp.]|nr:helix-turn-helix transcriptional regulator [Pseudohongiella sp.]
MSGIGERLREERKAMNLSQAEFGELGGVKANAQGQYEKGDRFPTADYMAAISAAGVDVLYVITGHRTPRHQEALSVRENIVLDNFRALSEEDRAAVQRLTHALAKSPEENHKAG